MKKLIIALTFVFVTTINTAEAADVPTSMVDGLLQNYIIREATVNIDMDMVRYFSQCIIYYSYQYNVDPLIVAAMIAQESHFNKDAISSAGAIGLGQLMPDTAEAIGVDPYNPEQNIQGVCSYISTQLRNFHDWNRPVECALAAYNAGPNAVKKYGGIPPYEETTNYVEMIKDKYFLLYDSLQAAMVA